MGMSTHVTGFVPPDEKWQQMKAVWDACEEAGVDIPGPVLDFFGDESPDPAGVERELPVREWRAGMGQGFELSVADIPQDVTVVRFWNEW